MEYKLVKKFLKDHEGHEIMKHEGNFSSMVWGCAAMLIQSPNFPGYFTGDFGTLATVMKGKKGLGFFNFDKYREASRQGLDRYLQDKKEFTELQESEEFMAETRRIYKKYDVQTINDMSDEELENFSKKCFVSIREFQVMSLFCEAMDEDLAVEYFEDMDTEGVSFEEFFEACSLVDFESMLFKKNQALLEHDYEKEEVCDVQWVFGSYVYTPKIDSCKELLEETLEEEEGIRGLREKQESVKEETSHNKDRTREFRKGLSGELKDLFDYIKKSMYLRDVRKKEIYQWVTMMSNALRELFSRLGIDENLIIYTIYDDFKTEKFKKTGFEEELKKRKEGFIVYYKKDGFEVEHVDFAEAKRQFYKGIFGDMKGVKKITGNTAQKGKAEGPVKVVLSEDDFSKLEEGDILVTSMTRPEYVPLMKRCSGIVTDEGGMTCHAAIVSRELKKPCILGTKNATTILRDGDIVELDTDKGIVNIIERDK